MYNAVGQKLVATAAGEQADETRGDLDQATLALVRGDGLGEARLDVVVDGGGGTGERGVEDGDGLMVCQ